MSSVPLIYLSVFTVFVQSYTVFVTKVRQYSLKVGTVAALSLLFLLPHEC